MRKPRLREESELPEVPQLGDESHALSYNIKCPFISKHLYLKERNALFQRHCILETMYSVFQTGNIQVTFYFVAISNKGGTKEEL